MDPDVDVVLDYYKHLFPDFSLLHFTVYKLLWRVEPLPVETIIEQTKLSKTTTYNILRDLALSGLVNKTNFSPVAYYAIDPLKTYNSNLKKILNKLEKGAEKLESLLENSSSLSGELYLVKREGGQQKLMIKQNRALLNDTQQLLEIKRVVEEQLREVDKHKLKTIAVYK
jgi:sugar-specific transcriptional regulator TrmB